VAYYYEEANNSTFRYRAYNMVQALTAGGDGSVGASYFFRGDLHRVDEIVDLADVLVICRSGYDQTIATLIARLRARKRPVLFDIDDFVFDPDFAHLIMNTLAVPTGDPAAWVYWFHYLAGMGTTLRACDAAITTNEFLADRLREHTGRPVAVVPNFMNREQLELSSQVFAEKQRHGFRGDGRIAFGYFSGSPSHKLDFAIVEPALTGLLEADERVHVMLVGYIEPCAQWARYGSRVIREPFHDYVNLQRLVGTVEFSLAPLQANIFTDCKSPLKVFEAAAVGTLSIASPSLNYATVVRDGSNGYLSRAHEWLHALERAMAQVPTYESMAVRARDETLRDYSWLGQREGIERALGWS
jgi:glycosyltransferase involved in cell wall biosynthesis